MSRKLLELLALEGPDIALAFEKASIQGRGTPQEVAEFRENHFREFISRYFPWPHRVAKGNIIDSFGMESASIDCVVLNPVHPHTIDRFEKFSVILAGGVDAVVELKPDISNTEELHRGLRQIQTVKRLTRKESPFLLQRLNPRPAHIVEHSKKIPAFLFAVKAKSDPLKTAREIFDFYEGNNTPLQEQLDYVVINQVGIVANYKYPELSKHKKRQTGLFFEGWSKNTVAQFLIYLSTVYPAVAAMEDPILTRYVTGLLPDIFERVA